MLLAGSGLVNVVAADNPLVFTDPVSLSFGDLNVRAGARGPAGFSPLSDAGGGAGVWNVEVRPQSASVGAKARGRRRRSASRRAASPRSASPRAPRAPRPPATTTASYVLRRGAVVRTDPVRVLRHSAWTRGADASPARALPGRLDRARVLERERLPLPGLPVRPAARLRRQADGREGRRDALRDARQQSRRQRRRRRHGRERRRAASTRGCSAPRTRTTSRAIRARRST